MYLGEFELGSLHAPMVDYSRPMSPPSFDQIPQALVRHRAGLHQQRCWLAGYGKCRGRTTAQHLISKGRTVKSPEAREACKWLLVPVCWGHNVGKLADAGWARRILAQRLSCVTGAEWLEFYIDAIPWRKPHPELSYEAIMSAPEPPRDLTERREEE